MNPRYSLLQAAIGCALLALMTSYIRIDDSGVWPRNIVLVSLFMVIAGLALILRAAIVSIDRRLRALEEHKQN